MQPFVRRVVSFFHIHSFFGLGSFIRKNGSVSILAVIATLVVVGNISAHQHVDDSFLLGHWNTQQKEKKERSRAQHTEEDFLLDGDIVRDTQISSITSEDKKRASEQGEMIVIGTENAEELFGESSLIEPRRTDAGDPDNEGDVVLYTVKDGDTLSTIARAHGITTSTLYWANEIEDVDDIMPGDTLFILPTSGLKHKVKARDTIKKIAKEYGVDAQKIISYNELPANGELTKGEEIIIPGYPRRTKRHSRTGTDFCRAYVCCDRKRQLQLGKLCCQKQRQKAHCGQQFPIRILYILCCKPSQSHMAR